MGGKIDAYLDCVSPYSYFALLYLLKNRDALASHGIDVEFYPVFLGGINVGSGKTSMLIQLRRPGLVPCKPRRNKPPWTLPAKAGYSAFDNKRAKAYFDCPNIKTPDFFPILSLLPQRCMAYVKATFPQEKYEASFRELFVAMWEQGLDLSKPELMADALSRHFSHDEVKRIIEGANSAEYKKKLSDNTQKALDLGAFGCPWFWVRNDKGEEEPFFGSDRLGFHYMWRYLGIPFNDIQIQEKGNAKL